MMEHLFSAENAVTLVSLSFMEIILGIDNIVFLSIVTADLPAEARNRTRRIGLILALGMRVLLLLAISWIMHLTKPWFHLGSHGVTGRDAILFGGGGFLVVKSLYEIYEKVEKHEDEEDGEKPRTEEGREKALLKKVLMVLLQIVILDIVFSLDSVITAVGMAKDVPVMVTAMFIAVGVMLIFAGQVGDFINRHPSMKLLALGFLVLIGVMLVSEGLSLHLTKETVYVAMTFSLFVELLNMRMRKNVHGRKPKASVHARRS